MSKIDVKHLNKFVNFTRIGKKKNKIIYKRFIIYYYIEARLSRERFYYRNNYCIYIMIVVASAQIIIFIWFINQSFCYRFIL